MRWRGLLSITCQLMLLFAGTVSATTSRFECKFVDYYLLLESSGFSHINHQLKINGVIVIKELAEQHWFIEQISCNRQGFKIMASHVQYNNPEQQHFLLRYQGSKGYKLSKITNH